ncbi:MAG: ribose-5-phosphate isomerase RpiA [Nitrospira sp.]|nr:ribose-5-phosphate isomerase RpiA [Nitrospira sp.]MCP9441987.1 ribose-5-phosphate isomerase RpiA [Nitrospira sp.]
MTPPSDLDSLKKAAALKAVEFVRDGMVIGLGTGSTAKHLVIALGEKVRAGLNLRGVATSQETALLATQVGIPLIDTDNRWEIDVAIDGADQVDPAFNLIKGGGGALLKEKIVAASARQFIVMVDQTKLVPVLGGSFPLPIEIIPFGWGSTARHIERVTKSPVVLRERHGAPFRTEAGNLIVDVHLDRIDHPQELEILLNLIPGVVETGLFVGRTNILIVGTTQEVQVHHVPKGS